MGCASSTTALFGIVFAIAICLTASCSSSSTNDQPSPGGAGGAAGSTSGGGSGGQAGASSGGSGAGVPDGAAGLPGTGGAAGSTSRHGKEDPVVCPDAGMNDDAGVGCVPPGKEMIFACVDQLTGAVELESYPEARSYWCDLVFDNPTDAFDCKTDVPVGLKQSITSGGLLDCVCKATGSIGFPNCSYDCVTAN